MASAKTATARAAPRKWWAEIRRYPVLPLAILALFVFAALFANLIAPYSPIKTALPQRLLPPFFVSGGSTSHLLGTDQLGRDVLSRIIFGARISLSVSALVVVTNSAIGTTLGILAGYIGGRLESFMMRVVDVSLALPGILIALLLAVILGPGFFTVVLAMTALGWASYTRLIRGETLKLRESDFVAQARINGASPVRIMTVHIFPNVVNSLTVMMTLGVGMAILVESSLSFLGAGIPPPTASWGSMVSDGKDLLDTAWWISTFPGLAIGLVVLSGNFLGDWLRDKMDPKLRQM